MLIDLRMLKHPCEPKFRSVEIISSIFSDRNAMKLEINHGKSKEKKPTPWRLNNMLLKNQWVNEEIKKEIKKFLETGSSRHGAVVNESK